MTSIRLTERVGKLEETLSECGKFADRIKHIEDAIVDISSILRERDNLETLIAQLQRSKSVQTPAPEAAPVDLDAEAPVEPPAAQAQETPADPVPAPAQITTAPAPLAAQPSIGSVESAWQPPSPMHFTAPALPSHPSLTMVLASLSPSVLARESKLLKRYFTHIDDYLSDNPPRDGVTMDYRILALTMEFVSNGKRETKFLPNSKEMTRDMAVAAVVWLLQRYKEHDSEAALALPPNMELLVHVIYDMLASEHFVVPSPEIVDPDNPHPKTHKKGKWALHWNTLRQRWTNRKAPKHD